MGKINILFKNFSILHAAWNRGPFQFSCRQYVIKLLNFYPIWCVRNKSHWFKFALPGCLWTRPLWMCIKACLHCLGTCLTSSFAGVDTWVLISPHQVLHVFEIQKWRCLSVCAHTPALAFLWCIHGNFLSNLLTSFYLFMVCVCVCLCVQCPRDGVTRFGDKCLYLLSPYLAFPYWTLATMRLAIVALVYIVVSGY